MRNVILELKVGEVWIEGIFEIMHYVVKIFTEIFRESYVNKPRLDGIVCRFLSVDDNMSLSTLFSSQELDVGIS